MNEYKIFSHTMVRTTTVEYSDMVPYCAVLLEDENGEKFPAILDGVKDGDEVAIGMKVVKDGELYKLA